MKISKKTFLNTSSAIALIAVFAVPIAANAADWDTDIDEIEGVVINADRDGSDNGIESFSVIVGSDHVDGTDPTAQAQLEIFNNQINLQTNTDVTGNLGVTGSYSSTNGNITLTNGNVNTQTLSVDGTSTLTGISNTGTLGQTGTANINTSGGAATNLGTGGTGVVNIGNTTGGTAITGTTTITGTTSVTGTTGLNTSGSATTNIGTGGTGVVNIGNTTGGTAITGTTTVTGATAISGGTADINVSSNNNTNINTGTSTGTVTIGNASSTTSILGTANINSTGVANTNIGNATGTTAVSGTTTITSANTFSSATFNNTGTSIIADDDATSGNGRGNFSVNQNSAALTVTNSAGNTHGLQVGTTNTVLSGGTASTTFTLDDEGATFANTTTGGPARVMGVADGHSAFDAVNVRQLNAVKRDIDDLEGGVASTAAMANIPNVDNGKKFALGMGYGNFKNNSALAVGGSARIAERAVVKASVGMSNSDATFGVGAGFSW